MVDRKRDSRERIVAGAADMMSRRGLNATSVRELAKHAKAPLGSTYHYFPGGKKQLAAEAVMFAGSSVRLALAQELASHGPVAGLRAFLEMWRNIVLRSEFRAGCPVLSVAVEDVDVEEPNPALAAAADVFSAWEELLSTSLSEAGASVVDAEQVATLVVAAAEGAVAMCRAKRATDPLDRVAIQLEQLIGSVISS
ncbi:MULTISPECIES: TetR/AcrR family transcriptional regulator [Rhodococcus]|uniref:TetR family transcriptional regulator n=1 Tax=Rhodococcus qingshengii TaxID=334542 RepID=A0A2A5IZF6_RHOSG|nr:MULTISPECIES: TetR/AcrR family transcriptional regulator [Rhodococcus]MDJ0105209.1 TetR/AcrR family transcriptional regulator [Rhodococcus erythropolis]MDV8015329.1 TetR/AcrR family transcriptional regulator [Rhodococcus sp. IEGM 1241]PCK22502.1 TetR family transcriptional regulator [Rhodococcus qingshengii]